MILITGATGNLGGEVTRRYINSDRKLRLISRTPEKLHVYKELGAEVVYGDFCNPQSVAKALKGIDKVVASVHSMLGWGKYSSKKVDLTGHKILIDEAKKANVSKFVFLSAMNASEDHPIDFWRYKYRVEEYLKKSGLDFTILRPSAYMETHAHMLLGQHVIENGQVSLFGKADNPRNFVAAEDVAKFVLMALEESSLSGKTIDVGGRDNVSSGGVIEIYSRITGMEPKIRRIPLFVVRVLSILIWPFHSGISRVMRAAIHSETSDMTFDSEPMTEKYSIEPLGLEEWIMKNAISATAGSE